MQNSSDPTVYTIGIYARLMNSNTVIKFSTRLKV